MTMWNERAMTDWQSGQDAHRGGGLTKCGAEGCTTATTSTSATDGWVCSKHGGTPRDDHACSYVLDMEGSVDGRPAIARYVPVDGGDPVFVCSKHDPVVGRAIERMGQQARWARRDDR
jgi:hypothetical protein